MRLRHVHRHGHGLLVTVAMLAVGAVIGWVALRRSGSDHAWPGVATVVAAELAPEEMTVG
jgi:threonine/homoserine efflux transporter RhtA